ncbi:MAG: rRNA maturation RNase YbeY [Lachnospiraceae bacterium]|nr:rRNA maturation RNase YbeY [Lachnospiraceae bacterium]
MTFYSEKVTKLCFDFDWKEVFETVAEAVLEQEGCPYESQISLMITDNEGIREFNRDNRGIDKETDVLSFPNIDFVQPSDFELVEEDEADYFDPETGELILGDIIISAEKVKQQAAEYGHSEKREYAFLVAHSMYHLCGYDHMEEEEEVVMNEKQELLLQYLEITRD